MKHSSTRRLAVLALAAVLASGLGAASASAAFAAGDADSDAKTTLHFPGGSGGKDGNGHGIRATNDPNSSVGPSYALEIDGILIHPIQEVAGVPGQPTGGEVTLTRRLTDDTSFQKWLENSRRDPNGARKNGAIILYDSDGAPMRRYVFTDGLPKSLENGTIMVDNTSVPAEKLVLTYKSMNPA
jgi:hypothetical protein